MRGRAGLSTLSKRRSPVVRHKNEEKPKHVSKVRTLRPTGGAPPAVVRVRHGSDLMVRQARGYSPGELEQAGLGMGLARRWGLSVDERRRSALEGNVSSLKKWSSQAKKVTVEARVEGEMRTIEKVVEKEIHRAGKEIHRAEKEMKKTGKETVEKIEAPVKKRSKKKTQTKPKTT
ncbi:MAG TPA: ribosomal protein L13e [Nitrososphaerales archaeon]|nr:ribosomal protein L13e [Nitrososphaerales archaeon]